MMTAEQSAAYIQSQVACAMIEAMGMVAENMQRQYRGESMAYTEKDFSALIENHCIGHNATLTIYNQVTP